MYVFYVHVCARAPVPQDERTLPPPPAGILELLLADIPPSPFHSLLPSSKRNGLGLTG